MTEQTTETTETAPEVQTSAPVTAPAPVQAPGPEAPDEAHGDREAEDGPPAREPYREQKLRRRAQEAEAEIARLRERLDVADRREAERLAALSLADPADLWIDVTLDDLRDPDSGLLDPERVRGAVHDLAKRRPQRDQLTDELEAARAEVERLTQQERDMGDALDVLEVDAAVMAEVAAIRKAVLGEAKERRQTLDSFRAALARLFDSFVLETGDIGPTPAAIGPFRFQGRDYPREELHRHPTLDLPEAGPVRQWLRPRIRPEAVRGWDEGEGFPALKKAALALSANDEDVLTT